MNYRFNSINTHWQYSVRGGGGRQYDPPVRAGHHGHPHLSALALLQAHRSARRSRTQGTCNIRLYS